MRNVLFWIIKFAILVILFTSITVPVYYFCGKLGIGVLDTSMGRIFFYGMLILIYIQSIDNRLNKLVYGIVEKIIK